MREFVKRAHAWIDHQSAQQKRAVERAPKGVPTYVGVVMMSAVVACIQLNVAAGILSVIVGWMLLAKLLQIHSDVIEERAWVSVSTSTQVGHSSGVRDRLPGWLTRPPGGPTLIACSIGLLWVLVFFGNDISTSAQSYSTLAFTSASYQDALALTEPNVFGFVSAQPCYYVAFSQLSWLFRMGPSDDICYAAASFLDPTVTPKAVLLVACTFLVVPTWWRILIMNATRNSHLGLEEKPSEQQF